MKIERAIEILDLNHREHYESIDIVNEACEMGRRALEKQIAKKIEIWNGQCACPNCEKLFGSLSQLKKLMHWEMPYCKFCGQALDWSDE